MKVLTQVSRRNSDDYIWCCPVECSRPRHPDEAMSAEQPEPTTSSGHVEEAFEFKSLALLVVFSLS